MKIDKSYKFQANFQIIDDLIRCRKLYEVFKYIYINHECTASEILKNIDMCKSTLYDYIDKADEIKLIRKDSKNEIHRNGAQFVIIATPKLLLLLKEFKTIIFTFFKDLWGEQDIL